MRALALFLRLTRTFLYFAGFLPLMFRDHLSTISILYPSLYFFAGLWISANVSVCSVSVDQYLAHRKSGMRKHDKGGAEGKTSVREGKGE